MLVKIEKNWKVEITPSRTHQGYRQKRSLEVQEYTLSAKERWPLLGLPPGDVVPGLKHFQGYGRFHKPTFTPATVTTRNLFLPSPLNPYEPHVRTHDEHGVTMINWLATIDLSYPKTAEEWHIHYPTAYFTMEINHAWGHGMVRNVIPGDLEGWERNLSGLLFVETHNQAFLDNKDGVWKLLTPKHVVSRQYLCPRWKIFSMSYHPATMMFNHGSSESCAYYWRERSSESWKRTQLEFA